MLTSLRWPLKWQFKQLRHALLSPEGYCKTDGRGVSLLGMGVGMQTPFTSSSAKPCIKTFGLEGARCPGSFGYFFTATQSIKSEMDTYDIV